MSSNSNTTILDTYKKALTTATSIAASAMVARTLINEFIPHELRHYIFSAIGDLRSRFSTSQHTIVIGQVESHCTNIIFDAVRVYLSTRINRSTKRIRASMAKEDKKMIVSMEAGEEMVDVHQGVEFNWKLVCKEVENSSSRNSEMRSFEVSFDMKYKDMVLDSYLPFIVSQAEEMKQAAKSLHLYLNDTDSWSSIKLHHPSTFETLAMDSKLKKTIMDDLARFVKRKEYYKKMGKAWKRGYLLYGPPGTGKSSLIAAMANYLKFDIYDLELSEVRFNSNLKDLLLEMSNQSILVIEDIDCAIDLQKRDEAETNECSNSSSSSLKPPKDTKVTLSGLLNFVDGLWSTSGEERIIVFTTNYKERLDPALLRPGRMDMHIHMSYLSFEGFKMLASNYHSIDDNPRFVEIERLFQKVEVTPAEIAEQLMRSDDTEIALDGVLEFLKKKEERRMEQESQNNMI